MFKYASIPNIYSFVQWADGNTTIHARCSSWLELSTLRPRVLDINSYQGQREAYSTSTTEYHNIASELSSRVMDSGDDPQRARHGGGIQLEVGINL